MEYSAIQKAAINTINDDLQIIACAGAGKTGVVTRRIINILKKKARIKPCNIVAFTFTEKAADELKSRIYKYAKEELGNTVGFAEMYVGTIHGFCLNMLQEYIPEFQTFSVLDEMKTKLFINRYYSESGMNDLDLKIYTETNLFLQVLSVLNESFENRKKWDQRTKTAVAKYKQLLYDHHYFDYSLILREMIEQLDSNKEFYKVVTERVKYLTVDEYQDINPIQESLIKRIKNGGCNLCVVGDDDQTIYQFRGSDQDNIITFKDRYNVKKSITLDTDYRSTSAIVDIAHRVILNNGRRLAKKMSSGADFSYEHGDTVIKEFDEIDEECEFVAEQIERLHSLGVPYSEIAVLIRKRKFGAFFSKAFEAHGIPHIVEGVNGLFDTRECQAAAGIFYYLENSISYDDLYALWCDVNYNINKRDIRNAINRLCKIDVCSLEFYSEFILQQIYHDFLKTIHIVETSRETEVILYNLGKFSQVINDFEAINYSCKPGRKLGGFCNYLRYTADGAYPEGQQDNVYIRPDAVNIMTVHQSKGLEFTAVFVPGLNKNNFPSARMGGKGIWHVIDRSFVINSDRFEGGEEDERKLFYVAVTRAKKYLFLTRAPFRRDKNRSVFLDEAMESEYLEQYDDKVKYSSRQLPPMKKEAAPLNLNFSILQDYFDCAYRFKISMFYGFVQPIDQAMGYGTSMHNIVRTIHKKYLDGGKLTANEVNKIVDDTFYLPYASDMLNEQMLKAAKRSVNQYFEKNKKDMDRIEMAEEAIELDLGDGIKVNGRIDLVKKIDEYGKEKTTIIDFKTANNNVTECVNTEQLRIYAIGYKELTGRSPDYLEVVNLDNAESERVRVTKSLEHEVVNDITKVADNIRSNKLKRHCTKSNCSECYINYLCLDKQGLEKYTKSRKRR